LVKSGRNESRSYLLLGINRGSGKGNRPMGFLIAGIIILIIASFWHSYASVVANSSPLYRPIVYYSNRNLFQLGWLALLLLGISFLFLYHWIAGIVGVLVYWFLLPLIVSHLVRKWYLPSWDELSDELKDILQGAWYSKENYLDGHWWKEDVAGNILRDLKNGI
jgi:hypothetical protein